jgi:predicted nuclease with TOPRIM domain
MNLSKIENVQPEQEPNNEQKTIVSTSAQVSANANVGSSFRSRIKDVRKLKQIQSQLNQLSGDAEALKIEVAAKQKEYQQKLEAVRRLKKEISKLDDETLKVSEHAIVRYFERVKGFDILEIEKEILSESVIKLVEQLGGNGSYPNESFSVVMINYTVTTVTV